VTGLRLADGREVVVKVRSPAPRLRGCVAVQAALAGAGFPCPRPLAGPAWLDGVAAAYEQARGRPWTPAERHACWAAGLWVRAFNAKKERLSGGGPQLERLAAEVGERAARAGLEA
jgi:hypothetical protein